MPSFDPPRAALAAAAARGADILPSLQLVLTAEALTAPPPACALDLAAELDALHCTCQALVQRRYGWLQTASSGAAAPVCLPRSLMRSTLLTYLRGVLRSEGNAVLQLTVQPHTALLVLQGGAPARMPGDLAALLHRCAAVGGGACVTVTGAAQYAAALRLPLAPGAPCYPPPDPDDDVLDRYSAYRVYLQGFCVEDD